MRATLVDWYNRHIVAGWYRSWAIWCGVVAAVSPYLLDLMAGALDAWPTLAGTVDLEPATKEAIRLVLLLVVLPALRAWRSDPAVLLVCALLAGWAAQTAGCSVAWLIEPWELQPGGEICSDRLGIPLGTMGCVAALLVAAHTSTTHASTRQTE